MSTTTESPRQSSASPKKARSSGKSKTKTGKWMDNESFRVNDDRSMIMLPEGDEDEDEPEHFTGIDREDNVNEVQTGPHRSSRPSVLTSRRNRMAGSGHQLGSRNHHFSPPSPPPSRSPNRQLTKRKLTSSSRTTRQDDLDEADDISRLAQALPGTPGQDYPIFGAIPRTAFNCGEHKWPGYYADIETQCQVSVEHFFVIF